MGRHTFYFAHKVAVHLRIDSLKDRQEPRVELDERANPATKRKNLSTRIVILSTTKTCGLGVRIRTNHHPPIPKPNGHGLCLEIAIDP